MSKDQIPVEETPSIPSAVTPICEIKDQFAPIVELPGWVPDKPFYARLAQISMLNLIHQGKIPNELLTLAHQLVTKGTNPIRGAQSTEDLKGFVDLMITVASCSLVEPTYHDLQENGISLTDDQLSWIYAYSQRGIQAMQRFREVARIDSKAGRDGESVGEGS